MREMEVHRWMPGIAEHETGAYRKSGMNYPGTKRQSI